MICSLDVKRSLTEILNKFVRKANIDSNSISTTKKSPKSFYKSYMSKIF